MSAKFALFGIKFPAASQNQPHVAKSIIFMAFVAIPIPELPGKQDIDIDVTINGHKRSIQYRVELLFWASCDTSQADRVNCIQRMLDNYEDGWTLYYIGAPTEEYVPLTFVRKTDLEFQRKLLRGELHGG